MTLKFCDSLPSPTRRYSHIEESRLPTNSFLHRTSRINPIHKVYFYTLLTLDDTTLSAIMSQDSIKQGESSKPRHSSPLAAPSNSASGQDDDQAPMYTRPNYMTVGSGSTSESAHRLAEMLDNDSGYGSVVDGNSEKAFNASLLEDRPTPPLELQGSDRCEYTSVMS